MFHEPQIDRDEQISAFYFLFSSAIHYPSSVALHFRATETQTRDRALPRASSTENSEGLKDLFDTQMSENLLPDGRDSSIVSLNALFLVLGTSFSPNGST